MLRDELKSVLIRFFVPASVALMPDRLGHAWLRFWARFSQLDDGNTEANWLVAQKTLNIQPEQKEAFIKRARLYALVDWADVYWWNSRSIRWLDRNVLFEGDSIPSEPVMAITLHYGAGLWALPAFSRYSSPLGWVHAPVADVVAKGHRITTWLSRWRVRTVRQIPGVSALSTPGALEKMQQCVTEQGSILGLIDAPFQEKRRCSRIDVLGKRFNMPNGFLRFAVAHHLPVYLFTLTLNEAGDGRIFRGRLLDRSLGFDEMLLELSKWTTESIVYDPAAWHLWRLLDTFTEGELKKPVIPALV